MKISSKLREAGLIGAESGAHGGYYLKKTLDEITILEVLDLMETSMKINRCLEPDAYCSRGAADTCPVRRFYLALQNAMEEHWASLSLRRIQQMYGSLQNDGIIGIEEARQQLCGNRAHTKEHHVNMNREQCKTVKKEGLTYIQY